MPRLASSTHAYTTADELGEAVETIPYIYGDANWKDKLTAYNGVPIAYDANGNPLNDGTWTYEWQAGQQLKRMSREGQTLTFKYDHNGMRVQKVLEHDGHLVTTNYIYRGKLLTHMTVRYTDFNGTDHIDKLYFFYDAQSQPINVVFNGEAYAYVRNLQGDIIGLLDSNGAFVVRYRYDAWGKKVSVAGNLASTLGVRNPFRYRGYVYDEDMALYYQEARYYNPALQRFISADQLVGTGKDLLIHNIFSYCINRPVMYVDRNGKWLDTFFDVVSLIGSIVEVVVNPVIRLRGQA